MAEPAKKRSSTKRTTKPKPDSAPGPMAGFDGGPNFDEQLAGDTGPPPPPKPESLVSSILADAGQTVGRDEIAQKLIMATGMLNDAQGAAVMADLTMTQHEAQLVASGLHDYSKRSKLVAQVFQPNPTMKFAIGWGSYGYRVWNQRRYNLMLLDLPGGEGVSQLGDVGTFMPEPTPMADAFAQTSPDPIAAGIDWLDTSHHPHQPPSDDGGIKPYNPIGD